LTRLVLKRIIFGWTHEYCRTPSELQGRYF
jgi:hypothetical protein